MNKIVAIAIAMFFVLSIVSAVVADEETGSYWGEVNSIDYHAKTVSMKPFAPFISPDATGGTTGVIFGADERTDVIKCNASKDFQDIRVGELVQIRYHEKNEKYIAESIAVRAPLTACNVTEKTVN